MIGMIIILIVIFGILAIILAMLITILDELIRRYRAMRRRGHEKVNHSSRRSGLTDSTGHDDSDYERDFFEEIQ